MPTEIRKPHFSSHPRSAFNKRSDEVRPPASPVHIILVDDDERIQFLMCDMIRQFAANWTLHVCMSYQTVAVGPPMQPRVLITEIAGSYTSCFDFIRKLTLSSPDIPVIVFTNRNDGTTMFNLIMAGASGYLVKPLPPAEIMLAIGRAVNGWPSFCQLTEKSLLLTLHSFGRNIAIWHLTCREQEIMGSICSNKSDKEIAECFKISVGTVRSHLSNIFRKVAVRSRIELKQKMLTLDTGRVL